MNVVAGIVGLMVAIGAIFFIIPILQNEVGTGYDVEETIHMGIIIDVKVDTSLFASSSTVFFEDGFVYTFSGVPRGLIIGEEYRIYKNKISGETKIDKT